MILDTLITDRTNADVARVKALSQKGFAAMTMAERAEYLQPMKGAYNATDLNRVQEACEYVANRLHQYGYAVDVQKIPHQRGGQSRLPDGYTQLEYIQSSGTQYINTGFAVSSGNYLNVKLEVDAVKLGASSVWQVDGTGSASTATLHIGTYNGLLYYGNGKSDTSTGKSCDGSVRRIYCLDMPNRKVYATGIAETTVSPAAPTATGNLFLFAYSGAGTSAYPFAEKVYGARIYENGTIARDFVPCRNQSNVLGLYDMVHGLFYGNNGSGVFTGGAEIAPPPVTDYEWIMSDIPTPAEMTIYIANIHHLREVFAIIAPQAPTDAESMTYTEANDIEQILILLDAAITRMTYTFRHCGTTYSNMGGLIL